MSARRIAATAKPAPELVGTHKKQLLCSRCARELRLEDRSPSVGPTDRHLIPMSTENSTVVVQETPRLLDRIAVTIPEAAILTGMPETRIRQAIYARELPVVQFTTGKEYYISVDDLREWFNRKKRTL